MLIYVVLKYVVKLLVGNVTFFFSLSAWWILRHNTPANRTLPSMPAVIAFNTNLDRGRLHEREDAINQAKLIFEPSSQRLPKFHSTLSADTPGHIVVHHIVAYTANFWVCIACPCSTGIEVMLKHPPITWINFWVITITVCFHLQGRITAPMVPRRQLSHGSDTSARRIYNAL